MITVVSGAVISATVFIGAFVSGIFGMVGGQILLAVLLYYMSVPAAMTLFSAMMFVNGLWRALLWRKHIDWPITLKYLGGAVIGYGLMMLIAFVPSKPVVYLGIGLMPLLGDLLPKRFAPDITKKGMSYIAGFVIMALQIAVGAAGNLLDMFFQASPLNRHAIVATKAITQLFSQAMRFLYFGALLDSVTDIVPWWFFIGLIEVVPVS
ncbi:MAG: sulfite exporter TauE/SafE family protein [Alphaproteobacteria bacterium]|nr:sulfite exporter TauE/SafE family protein [Alphaproteobacteria bacterium]